MTDFRALCQELMDAIDSGIPRGRIKQSPLAVRVDAALAQAEGEAVERVVELREKFEQLIKCSRAYGGYSTMTPVELADRLIDAVLKLEADR